jgi:glycosyltransferase involved in cell wall biosynthesis
MHVLFIPKWYPGRNDPQLGDFLRKQALAVSGHARVSVLHVAPLNELAQYELQELVEQDGPWELHCYYRQSTSPLAPLRKALNALRYRKAFLQGWQRVLRERGLPELVHIHILLRPALMAQMIQRRYGIPYLISEQSSGYLDGSFEARGAIYGRLARRVVRGAAGITAVSAWLGDALVEQGLCERYEVVPNVVPGLDRPLPPRGSPGQLLVVADLVDRTKNVSGVLRALALARKQDIRLQLTVIGDGPDRSTLEVLASSLGLSDVVRFLGRLANSEVLDHMARCWAVVINSNVETFSVVTGEALAQGKPVIATRCGGPIAFVTPKNGLLIDTRDDAGLAAAMLELLAQNERYDPATIRTTVSERFSYDAVGRAFMEQYHKALSHGK